MFLDPLDLLPMFLLPLLQLKSQSFVIFFKLADLHMQLMFTHGGVAYHLFEFLIICMNFCFLVDVSLDLLILFHVHKMQFFEGLTM